MDDERIEHALKLGPVDEPAYRAGVRARIGATANAPAAGSPPASTDDGPAIASPTRIDVRSRGGARTSRAPRLATLAQLAAVIVVAVVAAVVALPGLVGSPSTDEDLLARLTSAGSVSIGVPDAPPQVAVGGVQVGFDIDVARALADEMRLEPHVSLVAPSRFADASWSLALGPAPLVASQVAVASQPYASTPAWVAVPAGSAVQSLAALGGERVCVVSGSSGAGQLQAAVASRGVPPDGVTIVEGEDDDACVAAVGDGKANALVTSMLFDDELASRGLAPLPNGPLFFEPRVVVLRGSAADTATALAAVNRAIDELRASGRLADLSRRSFGGRDLTVPSP